MKVVIPPKKVVKRNENTTDICIKYATLLRMPFYISKSGVELQPVMQKKAILFLLPSKSDACRYGCNNLTTLFSQEPSISSVYAAPFLLCIQSSSTVPDTARFVPGLYLRPGRRHRPLCVRHIAASCARSAFHG